MRIAVKPETYIGIFTRSVERSVAESMLLMTTAGYEKTAMLRYATPSLTTASSRLKIRITVSGAAKPIPAKTNAARRPKVRDMPSVFLMPLMFPAPQYCDEKTAVPEHMPNIIMLRSQFHCAAMPTAES